MTDKELIYDTEIAPLMEKIIAICKKEDIPMIADFQYSDDGFCKTLIGPKERHLIFNLYDMLGRCREGSGFNIDRFVIYCANNYPNGSSIVLKLLGKEPEEARNDAETEV